jgi:hypothetical protein
MDFFVDQLMFCSGDFFSHFGIGFLKVLRDGFGLRLILKFSKYIFSHMLKIFLDDVSGLDILIDVKMFVSVILDDV